MYVDGNHADACFVILIFPFENNFMNSYVDFIACKGKNKFLDPFGKNKSLDHWSNFIFS